MLVGVALALGTSVSWALGNVFIQRSGRAVGGPRALTWALGLGGIMSAMAAWFFDHRTAPVDGRTAVWVAVAALSGLLAYVTIFYAFARAKLSLAVPFVSCWSLVAGLFSLVVLGKSAGSGQWVGAAIVILGIVLVSAGAGGRTDSAADSSPGTQLSQSRPLAAALVSGLSFGIMVPAMGQAAAALGDFGVASAVYLLGLIVAVPLCLLGKVGLAPPPRSAWGVVLGAGLFETLGFVCLNAAGRFASMVVVAPIASLAAAFTVIFAAVFLRERPGVVALCGALCASVGVVVLAL